MVKRELEDMKNADKCHNCCCVVKNTIQLKNKIKNVKLEKLEVELYIEK